MSTTVPPSVSAALTPAASGIQPCRNSYGHYLILGVPGRASRCVTHGGTDCGVGHTRVTTFVDAIDAKENLIAWKCMMTAKGLALRNDLLALAAAAKLPSELDDDTAARQAKGQWKRLTEDAADAAGASTGANLGDALHKFSERVDLGEDVTVPAPWAADLDAYRRERDALGLVVESARHVEQVVRLDIGGEPVAGTYDRLYRTTRPLTIQCATGRRFAVAAGELIVGDVKTGRIDYGQGKFGAQLAVYARARQSYSYATRLLTPAAPDVNTEVGLIVHMPPGAGQVTIHGLDLVEGWEQAEVCADIRARRKIRELVGSVDIAWDVEIDAATTYEEVTTIARRALDAGALTDTLRARARARRNDLTTLID